MQGSRLLLCYAPLLFTSSFPFMFSSRLGFQALDLIIYLSGHNAVKDKDAKVTYSFAKVVVITLSPPYFGIHT